MKAAVSVPDDVFEQIERLARREGRSRSEVFSAALREYVARHVPDEVTESMNAVADRIGESRETLVTEASKRLLENSEW
jgi:metal-responsive CopG/Arc/MetJ family transcriptional regulator